MASLFITGMLRSGTSLIQALLTNHPQLFVAYQPYHQFYVDVRQLFLKEHKLSKFLPLGDGMDGNEDERQLFKQWLQDRVFNDEETADLLANARTGKGCGVSEWQVPISADAGPFENIRQQIHASLAAYYKPLPMSYIGAKEVLCEEYIPALTSASVRCVLIVRDPRAVIASACHGRYLKSVGDRYPLMMLIRLWRKSAAYWLAYCKDPAVFALRYEDLVQDSDATLHQIATWLGIQPFPDELIHQPLRDHAGNVWKGNSSFGEKDGVEATSKETWQTLLTPEEIRYIEACTKPELSKLGYSFSKDLHRGDIADFHENTNGVREAYLTHYRLDDKNRKLELRRWDAAEQGQVEGKEDLFLYPRVFSQII